MTLTSAVELDPVVERVGAEIENQTERKIELETRSTRDLGGLVLRVGNMVWTRACAAGSRN